MNGKLVFTNGCFDVLHVGHVRLLKAARALGDFLIVGLNSDASIRRLKGPSRPVVPLEQRAEVLSCLRAVDLVVRFDEDTPELLVRRVKPDVLVKGADWLERKIAGADFVKARGGEVVLVALAEGVSTSGILSAWARREFVGTI